MSWFVMQPKVLVVLKAHFPSTPEADFEAKAFSIYDTWSVSNSLEGIERSDKYPTDDIKALKKIVARLNQTAKEFSSVGWHGNNALMSPAKRLLAAQNGTNGNPLLSMLEVSSVFEEHLRQIATSIANAIPDISEDAPSVITAFSEGPKFDRSNNKPKKTAAARTAEKCFDVYEELSGKLATVPSKDGKAYGPFLSFVTGTFDALEIVASPETWARAAKRIKRPKK